MSGQEQNPGAGSLLEEVPRLELRPDVSRHPSILADPGTWLKWLATAAMSRFGAKLQRREVQA